MSNLPLILIVCAVIYFFWTYIFVPTFVSPLSKIPNAHFSSSISSLWILWKRYAEQENRAIHAAHERYGKIVRLGPKDISVNSVHDGIRVIYTGGFEKGDWYPLQFHNFSLPCMFSMDKSRPHSIRKRMVSNLYSKSYLQSSADLHKLSSVIMYERLLPLIDSTVTEGETLNILELNLSVALDLFTSFAFGLGNDSNFLSDVEARREWLEAYQSRLQYRFWDAELPLVKNICRKVGLRVVPRHTDKATALLNEWTLSRCKAAADWTGSVSQSSGDDRRTPAIVFDHLTAAVKATTADDPALGPPEMQVASELHDHLQAAHETSGITLTYLFWELSRNPSIQTSLREELAGISPPIRFPVTERQNMPSFRTLDNLPVLHAVLMETLRLHSAIPGPQPRETPYPPKSVAGSPPLEPGIRISAQPYSLHRNADIFPEPELWRPARWLDVNEEQKAEMIKWFWAFGSGGRMCVGNNFAMQSMKFIVATIYTNFTGHIVDDTGIEQMDAYTAYPKGKKLIGRFERV